MTVTAGLPADPALYGLDGRAPGSPCTTPCTPDCTATCHERHSARPSHSEFYCDQIRIGRDVSEYRPDIRLRHEADLHAARAQAERGLLGAVFGGAEGGDLFGGEPGHFRSRRPSWPIRLLALLRRIAGGV